MALTLSIMWICLMLVVTFLDLIFWIVHSFEGPLMSRLTEMAQLADHPSLLLARKAKEAAKKLNKRVEKLPVGSPFLRSRPLAPLNCIYCWLRYRKSLLSLAFEELLIRHP